MPKVPHGTELYDGLGSFEGGVNYGRSPLRLPPQTLAGGSNLTVRGDFATHRPPFNKLYFSDPGNLLTGNANSAFSQGTFQSAAYYKPDSGYESIMAMIAGRLFQFQIQGTEVIFSEQTQSLPMTESAPQTWMWQAEKWLICQDGTVLPNFWNGTDSPVTNAQSNYGLGTTYTTTVSTAFQNPSFGELTPDVNNGSPPSPIAAFTSVSNLSVGTTININGYGLYIVTEISGTKVQLLSQNTTSRGGATIVSGAVVVWTVISGTQLQTGKNGTYGMGRNWFALPTGFQFLAGDLVGGSSGTQAQQFRDAVLNQTENTYVTGGGTFTVPGNNGPINAFRFLANLDVSLGQGPLQCFTNQVVFSCNAPVDRLTWQSLTNPILTESLIGNGALAQDSTVLANGDAMYRSSDGIRSLILGRRDFDTWGNVPISFEVSTILNKDDPQLLNFGSAVVFDNRLLMTCTPVQDSPGAYHQGLIALNFDPISSLRGKLPSVYDGLWTGLNVFKLITGPFQQVTRCFAFCWNITTQQLEIYELLTTDASDNTIVNDNQTAPTPTPNNGTRIVWDLQSASMIFGQNNIQTRDLLQLENGEIFVTDLVGQVDFEAYYKPDQWPCWVPWFSWSECQTSDSSISQPGFRPRMGLGSPPAAPCDPGTNRPLREGYTFQFRLVIRGHCTFLGARFKAITRPQPEFAKMGCGTLCNPATN